MGAENIKAAPWMAVWLGRAIIALGVVMLATGVLGVIGNALFGDGGFLSVIPGLYDVVEMSLGVCAFGSGLAYGKRWHLFGLLILVFFGSLVIGLFSMVGKETNVGYYIWGMGGVFSLVIGLTLFVNWEELKDG